jgi:hypothetical protein
MEKIDISKLLLKTAFSCMACDGKIDKREVVLIKKMHQEMQIFGDIDFANELEELLFEINSDCTKFLKKYFHELTSAVLPEKDELKLIETAILTIKADDKVEYSEIKFFKVIRSKLKIGNKQILELHPDFKEYLEQDIISDSYLAKLQDDYFNLESLPKFEMFSDLDSESLKNLTT